MSGEGAPAATLGDEAGIWHDVECAAYEADLALWRELAAERGGPILDLGSGTGRVTLDLAARGHQLVALDADPALLRVLAARARDLGLGPLTQAGDARSFELGRRFALVLAPMQVTQLLGGRTGRAAMLAAVRRHLRAGGLLALALADPLEGVPAEAALPPLPDVREAGGWVFSSTPVAVRSTHGGVAIDRHRQAVSPEGGLSESMASIQLDRVSAEELACEAGELGYRALPARGVSATADYVGSTIVMLEAP